jgi:beta-glucosidase
VLRGRYGKVMGERYDGVMGALRWGYGSATAGLWERYGKVMGALWEGYGSAMGRLWEHTPDSTVLTSTAALAPQAFNKFCQPPGGEAAVADDYCESEGTDRGTYELPAGQQRLVLALRRAAPTRPLVGLLVHGGTFAFGEGVLDALDAVLDAWQPGVGGAAAVAGALFGDFSPAGRTATTWYASGAQLPPPGQMSLYASGGITYRHHTGNVTFPFGYGLSYSRFEYSRLRVNVTAAAPCEPIGVVVDVSNVGPVAGDEVVQLYVKTPEATVPAPRVRLASFARVAIDPGRTTTVHLSVDAKARAVMSAAGAASTGDAIFAASSELEVEPGRLDLYVGGGQPDFFSRGLEASVAISSSSKLLAC